MMDTEKATLVICATLFLVVGFNAAIYAVVKRRKDSIGQIELLRRAARRARNPWEKENANLEALSKQVAELQDTKAGENQHNDQ